MINWLYKWLPIFCGCHCRDDRSFHYHGKKFPVCARCTGELVGMLASIVCCIFFRPDFWVCGLLMLPMIADGLIQLLTSYESTNFRRVVTGFLFGYALVAMIVQVGVCSYSFGVDLGRQLAQK